MNKLNESKLLNAVLQTSNSLIACIDNDLNYTYVNEAYENWFGLKSTNLIGISAIDVIGNSAYQKLRPYIDRVLCGEVVNFEMEVPYKIRGTRFVKTNYIPNLENDGSVSGFFIISEDMTSKYLAEKKIDKKEDEINKIIDSFPSLIGHWDKNLINVHANHAYSSYFGKSPEEMKNSHIKDIIGQTLFDKNLIYINKVLEGIPQSFERDIPMPNGSIRNTIANYIPNIIDGNVEGFFVTVTDITEVKEKSRIIQDQKQFFYEILNSMHEGFCVQDSEGKILYFNDSAAKILGLTNDQLLGKSSLDPNWKAIRTDGSNFPGEEHPAMETIRTKKAQINVTMGIQTPNGETRWLSVNSVPFYAEFEGQKSSVLVTFENETEKFQKDKMIAAVIENSPGMIYQFKLSRDGKMSFPFASSKVYEITEITEKEFKIDSSIIISLVVDEDREELIKAIEFSAKNMTTFEWIGKLQTKKGKLKWIKAKSNPRQVHDGSILWEGILTDITQDIYPQEELIKEKTKAAHAAKLASLGEMSAGVAHEINNPLAIILGMTKTLKNHIHDPEKFNHKIMLINNSVTRITKIINGLKRFARIGSIGTKGKHTLKAILQESSIYFELRAKQDYVDLNIELKSEFQIQCDPFEIEQVLLNLINNAIDAAKVLEDKWVKVLVFDDNYEVVIRIIDSGNGISEAVEQKLFDPFFTTKEVGQGTGLGLSISEKIINDHGGKITLLRELPNTCFEIRLPNDSSI